MSEDKAQLTTEQKQQVIDWIAKHETRNLQCPICEQSNWTLADHAVSPVPWKGNFLFGKSGAYPLMMVVCTNCAYTHFFNGVMVGIFGKTDGGEDQEKGNG